MKREATNTSPPVKYDRIKRIFCTYVATIAPSKPMFVKAAAPALNCNPFLWSYANSFLIYFYPNHLAPCVFELAIITSMDHFCMTSKANEAASYFFRYVTKFVK